MYEKAIEHLDRFNTEMNKTDWKDRTPETVGAALLAAYGETDFYRVAESFRIDVHTMKRLVRDEAKTHEAPADAELPPGYSIEDVGDYLILLSDYVEDEIGSSGNRAELVMMALVDYAKQSNQA